MKKILFFALVLWCVVLLFACGGTVTALEAKSADVKITLGSTVELKNYFSVEGNGSLDYSVSPTDILVPTKNGWTAAKEGTCTVTAYANDLSASFTLHVVDTKKIVVEVNNASFLYDGMVKNLPLDVDLPEGSIVEYRCGGALFTGATEPGTYSLTVDVVVPKGYSVEYAKKTATLTVLKKTLVVDDLRFRSQIVTYDGREKALTLEGQLPEGVTSSIKYFDSDGQEVAHVIDAGTYDAKAYFIVDERYYEDPPVMSGRLIVNKKELYEGGERAYSLTYDATEHFPTLDLPVGLSAQYYVLKGNDYVEKSDFYASFEGRPFTDSGVYVVRADLTLDQSLVKNYSAPASVTTVVTIDKADFVSDLKWREFNGVYTGQAYTLGYGEYPIGLYGDLPVGVGGEFSDGVTVSFRSNGTLAPTHDYVDAGKYSVTAVFTLPDGYAKNYNPLPDLNYTVTIQKANYPTNFVFQPIDQNEIDFSDGFTYDGNTHKFSLRFPTEEDKESFLEDCYLTYTVSKDGGSEMESSDYASILDAGNYTIGYKITFKSTTLSKNYNKPEDGGFSVVINKVIFDMTGVKYLPDTVVYDGGSHTILPTGVPDGVSYVVTGGDKTNAGVYELTAFFTPTDLPSADCLLSGENGEIRSLRTTLTVQKATYLVDDVPAFSVADAEYSYDGTLTDRPILLSGVPTSLAVWQDGEIVPTCDHTKYYAVYNADPTNYVGYVFLLDVITTPVELDAALFSVEEQFIPYNGQTARPKLLYDGQTTSSSAYRLTYRCDTEEKEIGTHRLYEMALELSDEVNYRLTGTSVLTECLVHVYDGGLYLYEGLMLSKYLGKQSAVILPDGTSSIKKDAFSGSAVTSLTLPSTMTSMSSSALAGMTSLRTLTVPYVGAEPGGALADVFGSAGLPDTLIEVIVTEDTTVAENAFKNCAGLRSVTYEKAVTAVGSGAFEGCALLQSLSFPDLTTLGEGAFKGCFALTHLALPFIGESGFTDPVSYIIGGNAAPYEYENYALSVLDLTSGGFTSVPESAFAGLTNLSELFLPDSVTTFGASVFDGISATVHLPSSLTALDYGVFWGYKGTEIELPDTLLSIGSNAFRGASRILIIYIPQKVTEIGENAFYGVSAKISFHENALLTRLGRRSFAGYAGSSVLLPTSLSDIDDYAFEGSSITGIVTAASLGTGVFRSCENLTTATLYSEVLPAETFSGCSNLSTVLLPNVTKVGEEAFNGCASLTSLSLPDVLTEIERYAFRNCSRLSGMIVRATSVPEMGSNALATDGTFTLYVPAGSVGAYQTAIEEKGYQNISVLPLP